MGGGGLGGPGGGGEGEGQTQGVDRRKEGIYYLLGGSRRRMCLEE